MNEEKNKAVVKRFVEQMWNQRQLELADELFAPDCVTHQLRGVVNSGAPRPPESVKSEAAVWLAAFPDLRFEIEQMFAADDYITTRLTMRGTHTGAWMELAPTGKKISVPMITIHRISDGKIAEDWVLVGSLSLFQQLGLLPDTPQIIATTKG